MATVPTSNAIQTIENGDTVQISGVASDNITMQYVSDATVTAYLYNPAKDPEHNATDRAAPDHTVLATYTPATNGYLAAVQTDSTWPFGVWTFRFVFVGPATSYTQSEYGQFLLNP